MNEKDECYTPEFYELVTADGKRYLSYHCFKCNKKHLIRTSQKEIARIRASFRIVTSRKGRMDDEMLILHCGKGKVPNIETDGIHIVITPNSIIPKRERDMIRKRIDRIVKFLPRIYYDNEEITTTEKMINQRIEKMNDQEQRIIKAREQMKKDLENLKRID